MCTYRKTQPEGQFTDQCLEDHIMGGLNERLDLLPDGGIVVTWPDGDRAMYEGKHESGWWMGRMTEFNDIPVTWAYVNGRWKREMHPEAGTP